MELSSYLKEECSSEGGGGDTLSAFIFIKLPNKNSPGNAAV